MKNIPFYLPLLLLFLVTACSKTDSLLQDNRSGFNPATEKEEVNRILQMRGSYLENTALPSRSAPINISGFTFRPPSLFLMRQWNDPGKMDTVEIGNETRAFIPIKFSDVEFGQYFKPVNVYLKVSGAKGRWKVPFEPDISQVAGSVSLAVPALVREGEFKISLCAELACIFPGYDSIRVFTDTVNALLTVRAPIPCGFDSLYGRSGLTIRKVDFGENTKAGKVKVRFKTFGIPDRLEVRYGGEFVISTCPVLPVNTSYPRCNENGCWPITYEEWWDYEFQYDPARGRFAEFLVLGWCPDKKTGWRIQVSCPR